MSDRHQELVQKLAELRRLVDNATLGPWRALESRDTWTLHGEARAFHTTKAKPIVAPSMQILKAPKHGTPYAEYWPNEFDGKLIVDAVNFLPFWLDFAEDVATRHFPRVCGCNNMHFLCAANPMYEWDQCPEVASLLKAMEHLHRTS